MLCLAVSRLRLLGRLSRLLRSFFKRFESWWTHIYNDISVFAAYKPDYKPTYLCPPFTSTTLSSLSQLPPGFSDLAQAGRIATDTIAIVSNIASYQEQTLHIYGDDSKSRIPQATRIHRHVTSLAALPSRKRYDDFYQACSCLLISGPHFEKFLVFALMLFTNFAFCASQEDRKRLACSHTAFRSPRACLSRDLPQFQIPPAVLEGRNSEDMQAVGPAMQECLVWMWLMLIESWKATEGEESQDAKELLGLFKVTYPEYVAWDRVHPVLERFFHTDEMVMSLRRSWLDSSGMGTPWT